MTRKKTRKQQVGKEVAEIRKSTAKKTLRKKKKQQPSRTSVKRSRRSAEPSSSWPARQRASGQSGDLQGISAVESADSESVDELLEEGNAFEAGLVEGVEDADAHNERSVHSREVPEDDVPGEYLDRDE